MAKNKAVSGAIPPAKRARKGAVSGPEMVPVPEIPVHGDPPAWAETRPELCDALPWFRSVQGGAYHNSQLCWGFLVDQDCGDRSHIDDEVVITRIGGGCAKDEGGNLVQIRDQDGEGAAFRALLNSRDGEHPVGLIIGDRNTVLGKKLPHRYNVMAYFRITDIWYEKVGQKKGAKVRFEKLDLGEKSWWAAKDSGAPAPLEERDFDTKPESHQCPSCAIASPRIYNEGWTCLQPSCKNFWRINGTDAPKNLSYHPHFLNYRTSPKSYIRPQYSLVPNLLETLSDEDTDIAYTRMAWKGIVCPQCHKCISRRFWRGWKCSDDITSNTANGTGTCSFEKMLTMHTASLRSVTSDFELGVEGRRAFVFSPKYMTPAFEDLGSYQKYTYQIPGVGSVTHFVATKSVNSRLNGPNDLFKQLQALDIPLRRYPLQQSVVAGTLTSHFAVNYGMPYKYVVSVDSKGFDEAPREIMRALGRLTWATEHAINAAGDTFLPPNELLMLGYFEDMAIGYHDDGESSLGPTISTLSLGASAKMYIRMKDKYYNGCSASKKLLAHDPVLENCAKYDERRELKQQLENGVITNAVYNERRQKLLEGIKRKEAAPLIYMPINHGDLVVMHGANLQKYYEHSVIPDGRLRFALTSRYIMPELVEPKDHPKGHFTLAPDEIYDGE
ncbi:hypothetical protein VTN00DRAFT_6124 [Thermoascus crustaceus]|uniref:uncharacterized protein n=1 Tax=Thermoascus crustaceus TaxID=5088 RepID=UPI0037445F75